MEPICIMPGRDDWEAFVGGDFFSAETDDDGSFRWLGENDGWIYLPEISISSGASLRIVFEGGCNPWGGARLMLVRVPASGAMGAYQRAIPMNMTDFSGSNRTTDILPHNPRGFVEYRIIERPILEVFLDDAPLVPLEFENRPGIQTLGVDVPATSVLNAKAMRLRPNFAFSPADLGHPEKRRLSFRINRIIISQSHGT